MAQHSTDIFFVLQSFEDDIRATGTVYSSLQRLDPSAPPTDEPGWLTWDTLIQSPTHAFWRTRDLLNADAQLSFHLELLERVTMEVATIHERAWIHRDLKPAHVLISETTEQLRISGREAMLNLSDPSAPAGYTDRLVGTPAFMPLEQALHEVTAQGPASDLPPRRGPQYRQRRGARQRPLRRIPL